MFLFIDSFISTCRLHQCPYNIQEDGTFVLLEIHEDKMICEKHLITQCKNQLISYKDFWWKSTNDFFNYIQNHSNRMSNVKFYLKINNICFVNVIKE